MASVGEGSVWLQALTASFIIGAAISGYVVPALDLRRQGRLTPRLLMATYSRQVRLIPGRSVSLSPGRFGTRGAGKVRLPAGCS